ncbi:MAG: hypothetical protein ACOYL6_06705 [Bacteriovoracaceae bacterium]
MAEKNNRNYLQVFSHRTLAALHHFLGLVLKFFLTFPKSILMVFIVLVIFAGIEGRKVRIAIRTEDMNDPSLSSHQDMQKLKSDYGFEDKLTFVFKKESPFTGDDFCLLKKFLDELQKSEPMVIAISSPFELRDINFQNDKLFYPTVLKDVCQGGFSETRLRDHPYFPFFADPNLKDVIVHLQIKESEKKFRHGIYDYQIIEKLILRAQKELPFQVLPGGTLFFQKSVLDGIHWSNKLNILAGLFLFLTFFYFYRSWKASLGLVFIVLLTNTMLKGAMGFFDHAIDPLSSCLFLMMTVAVIEDYVFVCFVMRNEGKTFEEAIQKLLLPSFLTSLTTAIGFGSLVMSHNPNIIHFGLWSALGAMLEWAFLLLLTPALFQVFPKLKSIFVFNKKISEPTFFQLTKLRMPRKFTMIISCFPLLLLFIYGEANLSYSPFDMFDSDHAISDYRNHFQNTRGAEGEVSLLFPRGSLDVSVVLEIMKKDPMVAQVYSLNNLRSLLQRYPTYLHSMIMEDFMKTQLGQLFSSSENERALLYVKSYDTKDIESFEQRTKKVCGNRCKIVSEVIVSKDYAQGLLQTLYDSFTFCFLLVFIIMVWLCLAVNPKAIISVTISTLWAPAMLLIVVILGQFKINVVTSVALSVLVGLTGDNAIQFLLLGSENLKESVENYGKASLQSFLLMTMMTLILFFSYFKSPKVLGALLLLGLVFMFVGDLWVLNGLLKAHSKSDVKRL